MSGARDSDGAPAGRTLWGWEGCTMAGESVDPGAVLVNSISPSSVAGRGVDMPDSPCSVSGLDGPVSDATAAGVFVVDASDLLVTG